MIKAVLLDFDGTIVYEDILDVVAGINGKREESERINEEFHNGVKPGLTGLIERINLLKGISLSQIRETLDKEAFLMPGASEFFAFLRSKRIVSIVGSGNILPILEYYKRLLGIDYVVGTSPRMKGDVIVGIREEDFPDKDFKLTESFKLLKRLGIAAEEIMAIGDSPGDKRRFLFAGKSIAINPKGGVEKYVDYVIEGDLRKAIPLLG